MTRPFYLTPRYLGLLFTTYLLSACGGGSNDNSTKEPQSPATTISTTAPSVAPSTTPNASPTPSLEPSGEPSLQSYRIDWLAPEQRVDGSTLSNEEISGYVLKWTNLADQQSEQVELGADVERWDLTLPAGQYQFAIATKDYQGRLSQFVTANP